MKFRLVRSSSLSVARFSGSMPSGLARALLLAIMCLALSFSGAAVAQLRAVGGISTVAGVGQIGSTGDGGSARVATLHYPSGVAIDRAGNTFIADSGNNKVREISAATGVITTIAGNGTAGFAGDGGAAINAELNLPVDVVVDAAGNVYISDFNNYRIRKVSAATGQISTVAGNGTQGSAGDGGVATSAQLSVDGIAIDTTGAIYIADLSSQRIRKVSPSGVITTVAGNGIQGFAGDGGAATSAELAEPAYVTLDPAGNLYIMDYGNQRIREVTASTGVIATIAGIGFTSNGDSGDGGPAVKAAISDGGGVAISPGGDLFLAERSGNVIRQVSLATGIITTISGTGSRGYSGDGGAASAATMSAPTNMRFDGAGNLYVAEQSNNIIREISPSTLFATTPVNQSAAPQNVYLQTTAVEAISSFTIPKSLGGAQEYTVGTVTGCLVNGATTNPVGTVCTIPVTFKPAYPGYRPLPLQAVTGTTNINVGLNGLGTGPLAAFTPGIIHNYAGTENSPQGNSGNGGPATSAVLDYPTFVTTDSAGNLYFNDFQNCVIQKVTAATGILTVVAGSTCNFATYAPAGDGGPATSATLGAPKGIVLDSAHNLYIADQFYIRKVDAATGIITSIAGTGTNGYSGDGGPATAANLDQTNGIGIDSLGNLYLDSSANSVIRKIAASSGIISTVVGNGTQGYSGDGGPATAAQLNNPLAVTVDNGGNLFILDSGNGVVREVNVLTGTISTVAGNGKQGTSGDGGPATSASLTVPTDIAVDAAGDLYVVTGGLVRKVSAASGTIVTVAGSTRNGNVPYAGDGGPATLATDNPNNVAIDAAGNLYMSSSGDNGITVVPAAPSQLSYPTTTSVGSADSADDPMTATLSDIGNASLTISSPLTGQNPAITASWSLDRAATCPQLSTLSAPATLAAGAACTFATDFIPTMPGALTGTLVVTDNSLNTPGSTQTVNLSGTGLGVATASATLTPASANYGNVATGQNPSTATQSFTFTNTGNVSLNNSYTLGGTNPGAYSITGNGCATTVLAGATCTIIVTFTPTTPGTFMASLVVTSYSNVNTMTEFSTLTGVGVTPPALTITPAHLNFPNTVVNTTSAAQMLTLTNTGGTALQFNATTGTLGGPSAANFAIVGGTCGLTLAAGASCTISFTFTPDNTGGFYATYTVASNDPNSPTVAALSGFGTAAALTLSPNPIVFNTTMANTTAASIPLTLTNTGAATLQLKAGTGTLSGSNAANYAVVGDTCGLSLAVGASCTVTFTFTPNAAGAFYAAYSVPSNDPLSPAVENLIGYGSTAPQAALTPSLDFGSVNLGSKSSQVATLTNSGTAPLTIVEYAIGAGGPQYAVTATTCGASLAAGSSCAFTLSFAPSVQGPQTGFFYVQDTIGQQTTMLSGVGAPAAAPQATLTPIMFSFTPTTVGTTSAAQAFTLTNAGNAALTISSVTLSNGPFMISTNSCGGTLAAGSSCQIGIVFSPTAVGGSSATLSVVDAVGTQSSLIAGTGLAVPAPQAALTPATVKFGTVNVASSSSAQTFTLSNAGNAPLTIGTVALVGSNAASFKESNGCGSSLAAGTSCQIGVIFTPTAAGAATATLTIVDSVGTQTSALSGTGLAVVAADFTVTTASPAQSSFLGGSVAYTFQVGSLLASNPFNSAVSLSVTGLPAGATASFSPPTVSPGSAGTTSTLTVNAPPVLAQQDMPTGVRALGVSLAGIFAFLTVGFRRRRPRLMMLALLALLGASALSTTGCGSGTGFAIPTTTSTLVVTGTSGAIAHSTSVTLTIK